MTDWSTVLLLWAALPVDAVVVGYVMAWFIVRKIGKVWKEEEKKRKKWWNPLG